MSTPYDYQSYQPYPARPPHAGLIRQPFQATKVLAWATVIGLGILAFGYLIEAGLGIGQILDPKLNMPSDDGGQTPLWLGLQALSAMFRLLLYLATIVLFLIWLYRSFSNLRPLRAQRVDHTPGWAVGWWFIPFANLVKPFQVVREVWRESDPEFDQTMGFSSLNDGSAPLTMSFWWLFWLTSTFATNVVWRLSDSKITDLDQILGVLFLIAGGLSFGAAILAIVVVRDITKRQELRLQGILALPQENPYLQPGFQPPAPPTF